MFGFGENLNDSKSTLNSYFPKNEDSARKEFDKEEYKKRKDASTH